MARQRGAMTQINPPALAIDIAAAA